MSNLYIEYYDKATRKCARAYFASRRPWSTSTYVRTISRPYQSTHACMHTHTRDVRMHACMCTHTRVTFRPESKSDLESCETIRKLRSVWQTRYIESRTRLAYTVYARARTRLSACACAGYAYSYAPAQMTERTYVHTYIYPENRSRFILPRANALGNKPQLLVNVRLCMYTYKSKTARGLSAFHFVLERLWSGVLICCCGVCKYLVSWLYL